MTTIKQAANVSSITISGNVLTPVAGKVTPPTDALSTILNHPHSRPKLVRTAANGDITIRFPPQVSSITLASVVYTPNGAGEITVPAAVGTAYLEETKYFP